MTDNRQLPHLDNVTAHASWMMVQSLAMLLVRDGVVARGELQNALDDAAAAMDRVLDNPAQKASGHLLRHFRDMLHTADRSGTN